MPKHRSRCLVAPTTRTPALNEMIKDGYPLIGYVLLVLGLSQLCLAVSIQQYEFDKCAGGWLRLHSKPATWLEAKLRCEVEGGILASPITDPLSAAMTAKMAADSLQHNSVFTGMHAKISKGDFRSNDGGIVPAPTTDMLSAAMTAIIKRNTTSSTNFLSSNPLLIVLAQGASKETNSLDDEEHCLTLTSAGQFAYASCTGELPYFCYKSNSVMSESVCSTNKGYKLEPRTGSCYKFHRTGIPWYRAAMKCASEDAYLAVINSDVESQVLKELFAQNPRETIIDSWDNGRHAHIGFLDWNRTGEWLTVFGETFEEAGFNKWDVNEPSNFKRDEYCGSVGRSGKLNDSPCVAKKLPYICESTPK